jgi:hypothetical protein
MVLTACFALSPVIGFLVTVAGGYGFVESPVGPT